MTYEEQILRNAERKCEKLYIAEFIFAGAGLTAALVSVFKGYEILLITGICFILCAVLEIIMFFIIRKAMKHIDRRLTKINESLKKTVQNCSQDKLIEETKEFNKEYGFLEEK
ncbi:MAG: hypothetical protein IJA12_02505 [Oscillospiraceae bacterium]|nr:hypothetical protein [Oscillospiraceae bacterium]